MGRKWQNIKYSKAAKDASRSKIYAKFGKEIYMAAKDDANPESNRTLKNVLDKAKTYNVTKDIIDRALAKAKSGVDESYDFIRYEGYGPSGSAIIVDTLTDNVNRTVADVRAAFNKAKGNLGVNGSVAYLFQATSVIGIDVQDEEKILELLIDSDIDVYDIEVEDDKTMIYASVEDYSKVQDALKTIGIEELKVAEISMLANDQIDLEEEDLIVFEKLIDTLEDLDDVQDVYSNVN